MYSLSKEIGTKLLDFFVKICYYNKNIGRKPMLRTEVFRFLH